MKKLIGFTATVLFLLTLSSTTAFAGTWKQDAQGFWWQEENKSYPVSCWKWIDSDKDGLAECYYFNEDGYLLTETTAPDGSRVNKDGAWIDSGIIRQKAVTPSGAKQSQTEGLALYQEAKGKNAALPEQDLQEVIEMGFSYSDWLEFSLSINVGLQYKNLNTGDMEFLLSYSTDMDFAELLGTAGSVTTFYKDGCYYMDLGDGEKYKMKIGYEESSESISSSFTEISPQDGALLKNVEFARDEAGNYVFLYSINGGNLKEQTKEILNNYSYFLESYDFQITDPNGKAVISPEGYLLEESLSFQMSCTGDEELEEPLQILANIHLNYNNPGQPVTINFPSLKGFEELIY